MAKKPKTVVCAMRMNPVLLEKFKFIAAQNERSVRGEFELMLKKRIAEYEAAHGKIPYAAAPDKEE